MDWDHLAMLPLSLTIGNQATNERTDYRPRMLNERDAEPVRG